MTHDPTSYDCFRLSDSRTNGTCTKSTSTSTASTVREKNEEDHRISALKYVYIHR
jgi:hypothetical protein